MPKVQPFMKFMKFKQKTLRHEDGSLYSLVDLQKICGPLWQEMSEKERQVYKPKGTRNVVEQPKYTCSGQTIKSIENAKMEEKQYVKNMNTYIKTWLDALHSGEGIQKGVFFILSILNYVEESAKIIPAEIGIVKVSFEHGIIDEFHYLFDSNIIPAEYAATALEISTDRHKLPTSKSDEEIDYEDFTGKFLRFIQSERMDVPIYCLWADYRNIRRSLEYIHVGLNNVLIYSLSTLFTDMILFTQLTKAAPIPDLLDSCEYDHNSWTGCLIHRAKYEDGLHYCALGKCQRLFYIMCSNLEIEKSFGIKLLPYKHVPGSRTEITVDSVGFPGSSPSPCERPKETSKQTNTFKKWASRTEPRPNLPSSIANLNLNKDINISSNQEFPSLGVSAGKRLPAMAGVEMPNKAWNVGIGRGRRGNPHNNQ